MMYDSIILRYVIAHTVRIISFHNFWLTKANILITVHPIRKTVDDLVIFILIILSPINCNYCNIDVIDVRVSPGTRTNVPPKKIFGIPVFGTRGENPTHCD
jgi:hypothetical protein